MSETIYLGCLDSGSEEPIEIVERPKLVKRSFKYKPKKRKYTQNWAAYNKSQTQEKFLHLRILHEAVESLGIKTYGLKNGRPPHRLKDMIKCCCIKVFNGFSSRRTIPDLTVAHALNYIEKVPHFNSILNYMRNPFITRFMYRLVTKLAQPLDQYETHFAIDATGIGAPNRDRWMHVKGHYKKYKDYRKLHACYGAFTNVVVSCKVTTATVNDSVEFRTLLGKIKDKFTIGEVSADAAYLSRANVQAVADIDAQPYIMIKKNTLTASKGTFAWGRMVRLFKKNEQAFRERYHLRSNSETGFMMIKQKYGHYVYSKSKTGQENEILAKVVNHNISCLVSAVFELNLDLTDVF